MFQGSLIDSCPLGCYLDRYDRCERALLETLGAPKAVWRVEKKERKRKKEQ